MGESRACELEWGYINKQIIKKIRSYYKSLKCGTLEEKEQNKSRNAVYVVEITDE